MRKYKKKQKTPKRKYVLKSVKRLREIKHVENVEVPRERECFGPEKLDRRNRRSKTCRWLKEGELSILSKGGYFDAHGVLHTKDNRIQCAGIISGTTNRCRNFSLPGSNYCPYHGGKSKGLVFSPFIKNKTLKEMAEEFSTDNSLDTVKNEVALMRSLFMQTVNSFTEKDGFDPYELRQISSVIGEIRQLISTCLNMEEQSGRLIDVKSVVIIVNHLTKIIDKNVKDRDVIKRIANEFSRIPWPGSVKSTPGFVDDKPVRALPATTEVVCGRRTGGKIADNKTEDYIKGDFKVQ